MGEIYDDIINGSCCSWCGIYFKEAHEYPVICKSCAKDSNPKGMEECGVQLAINDEL